MPDELPPLSNDPIKFPGIPPLPPPLPIYRREDYGSVAGRKITEWVHVEGTPEDPDCPRFIGTGGVPIEETFRSPDGKTAQKQTRIASVNFIIPVDNILDAFDSFDRCLLAEGARVVKQMRANDTRARLTDGLQ